MSSILQPLQTQLPAQAMQQSATALSAYEQLRGIRQRRVEEGRQLFQQDLVRRLIGPAAQGDVRSLEMLKVTDPNAFYGLMDTQRRNQMAQMQYGETTKAVSRDDALRRLRGMQNAFANLKNVAPENQQVYYDMLRSRIETEGLLEPDTLQDQYTPEVAEDVRLQLQIGHDLLSDDVSMDKLTREERAIASAFGKGTPEYRQYMKDAIARDGMALFAKKKIKEAPLLPPGITVLPGVKQDLSTEEAKQVRRIAEDGVGVLQDINDLMHFISTVGPQFELRGNKWTETAEGQLARQKAKFIQNKMRQSAGMGTLDNGAVQMLSGMFPDDPTGFNQRAINGMMQEAMKSFQRGFAQNLRNYNTRVDLGQLTQGYLQGTSEDFLTPRPMADSLSGKNVDQPRPGVTPKTGEAATLENISNEVRRLRLAGTDEVEARIAAAAMHGYVYDNGKYYRMGGTQQPQAQSAAAQQTAPVIGQEQSLPVGTDSPFAEQRTMPDIQLPEMTQEQMAANNELQALIANGSPQQRYTAQPNELPPGPDEPAKQQEYFSNMYSQGHDRELIMRHYMGVWGEDGQGALGQGNNRRPNLKVAPLPRLLTAKERKEQQDWEQQVERLRLLAGEKQRQFMAQKQAQYLQEQRRQFVESGEAARAAQQSAPTAQQAPIRLTRSQMRQLAIQRRQEAARRRYESKLRGVAGAFDSSGIYEGMAGVDEATGQSTWQGQRSVNDILEPVMPKR